LQLNKVIHGFFILHSREASQQQGMLARCIFNKSGGNMQLTEKHKEYWQKNLRMTGFLLVVWFVVTFVIAYYARDLQSITIIGFPLSFYMGAQGSLAIYVAIIWYYAHYMNKLDQEYGVHEGDD